MEHTKHIWRAVLILIALGLAGFIARHFLIPRSFGEEGYYRSDSVLEFMNKPLVHGGQGSCDACHSEQSSAAAAGKHSGVHCEVCHGALADHITDGAKSAAMPTNLSHTLCANCHQKLRARPATMPQVDVMIHLTELDMLAHGESPPEGICTSCHDNHDPSL